MDPLSRLLILLNPRTYNCGGLDLGAASAIHFPRHDGLKCYAVISGEAWLSVDGVPDLVHLRAGECFLLPRGRPFCLAGKQDSARLAACSEVEAVQCGTIATYGEGGQCLIVGAHYAFTTMQAVMLLELLPPIVHLQNSVENVALCWTLRRMSEELLHPQPGGVVVAHSLARMMLVQALRVHIADNARNGSGGLSVLTDAQMSRAIACIQQEPALDWTVKKLANQAGMSRAGFALKFRETVHQSPIEYLTRWRMLLAEDRMAGTTDSIAEIARSLGYESASAFSKVFKKVTGRSPRQHRQWLRTAASRE